MHINNTKVKSLRLAKNWTQSQLAELCDISLRTIQRVEKQGLASAETLMSLCAVFEVEQSYLADNVNSVTQAPNASAKLNLMLILTSSVIGIVVGATLTFLLIGSW